jgi:hypothetical protein
MIHLVGRLPTVVSAQGMVASRDKAPPAGAQSFATELAAKLSITGRGLQPVANPLAASPASQQSVTWRSSGGAGFTSLVMPTPGTQPLAPPAASSSSEVQLSFDDAYWAKQPAAVQQLRDIQDPAQKTQVATELAQQGYAIDAPIMVWGWDPQITTQLRQSFGYTWVPSALQQPVEVAPGLTVPGLPSYDPAHPPPGSIAV